MSSFLQTTMITVDALCMSLSKLDLYETKTRKIKEYVNTISQLEPYEPWVLLPPKYVAPRDRRMDMPHFTFGLGLASEDEMVEFAAQVVPRHASKAHSNPDIAMAVIENRLNEICELQIGNKILIEEVRSKEAKFVILLTHTYTLKRTVEDKKVKLDEELERIGWKDRKLKWYISGDNFTEWTDWHIPLLEE